MRTKGQVGARLIVIFGAAGATAGLTGSIHNHWTDGSETALLVVGLALAVVGAAMYMWLDRRRRPDR